MFLRYLLSLWSPQSWSLCRVGPERWAQQIHFAGAGAGPGGHSMDSGEAAGGQLPDCAREDTVLGLPASDPWKKQQIP